MKRFNKYILFILLISSFVILTSSTVYALDEVQKINIPYTGGTNKIQGPKNSKFLHNVNATIAIIEYLKNTIGLKEATKDPVAFLKLELYSPIEDYRTIEMYDKNAGNNEKIGNPTIEDIFSDTKYIDPIISEQNLNEQTLQGALADLKEHVPEGTVENFLYRFTRIQLLIIEVMSIFFFIYGGLIWLTSGGEESRIENGKKIILWAIVGIIGGLISYTVMNIVVQVFT